MRIGHIGWTKHNVFLQNDVKDNLPFIMTSFRRRICGSGLLKIKNETSASGVIHTLKMKYESCLSFIIIERKIKPYHHFKAYCLSSFVADK